jgi:hypothetical protein
MKETGNVIKDKLTAVPALTVGKSTNVFIALIFKHYKFLKKESSNLNKSLNIASTFSEECISLSRKTDQDLYLTHEHRLK